MGLPCPAFQATAVVEEGEGHPHAWLRTEPGRGRAPLGLISTLHLTGEGDFHWPHWQFTSIQSLHGKVNSELQRADFNPILQVTSTWEGCQREWWWHGTTKKIPCFVQGKKLCSQLPEYLASSWRLNLALGGGWEEAHSTRPERDQSTNRGRGPATGALSKQPSQTKKVSRILNDPKQATCYFPFGRSEAGG